MDASGCNGNLLHTRASCLIHNHKGDGMTQDQLPTRRGLAELDDQLSEPERRCAQRLRDLRARIGLTSEELAEKLSSEDLPIDKTRLSKYLNGREVPRHEFAARIHRILAEREDSEVSEPDH